MKRMEDNGDTVHSNLNCNTLRICSVIRDQIEFFHRHLDVEIPKGDPYRSLFGMKSSRLSGEVARKTRTQKQIVEDVIDAEDIQFSL